MTPPDADLSNVVAVVLNWNGGEDTRRCLASLRAVEAPRPRLLLVDNGSTDGSVETARADDDALEVLQTGSNLGYAGGNNRGLAHAFDELGADWVCLVNNDVEAPADLFTRLSEGLAAARSDGRGEVGALGPRVVYLDDPERVWAAGGRIGAGLNVTQLLDHDEPLGPPGEPRDVDYVPGTCLLISRAAWDAVGGLDEDFFCYLEDADWCLRLRDAGLRAVVAPGAVARHGLSSSTGGGYSPGRKYMTAVNSVHFLRKHGGWSGWTAWIVFDLLLWPAALLRGLVRGHAAGAVAKLRGLWDGLRGVKVTADVAARYARKGQ